MVTMKHIKDVGRQIAREFHPQRVVLFGSHASGNADTDSDVDLLVVMPFKGKSVAKSAEIRLKISAPFPVDLLVRTPQAIRRRIEMGDCFMQRIIERGKVLYEAPDD